MAKELEIRLKKALRPDEDGINAAHIQQVIMMARQEYAHKAQRKRTGFGAFLISQVRFIGWRIWVVQGAFLLLLCGCFSTVLGEYLLYSPRRVALLLCCLAIAVSMTAVPFIYRSIRYQMDEVEMATRNSSGRLLVAKLLVTGLGDGLTLACIFGMTTLKTSLRVDSIALYLVFPFLLASCGGLYLLGHLPMERFMPASLGMGAVLLTGVFLLSQLYPAFFEQIFSAGWAAVCIALALFGAKQVQHLMEQSSFGETQTV